MSETIKLSDLVRQLHASSIWQTVLAADADGTLSKISPSLFQSSVLTIKNSINLDKPGANGIFSLYSGTGTKPEGEIYGIVISIGVTDIYQLAITHNCRLYIRASLNGNIGTWKLAGGGKTLSLNRLAILPERRVA